MTGTQSAIWTNIPVTDASPPPRHDLGSAIISVPFSKRSTKKQGSIAASALEDIDLNEFVMMDFDFSGIDLDSGRDSEASNAPAFGGEVKLLRPPLGMELVLIGGKTQTSVEALFAFDFGSQSWKKYTPSISPELQKDYRNLEDIGRSQFGCAYYGSSVYMFGGAKGATKMSDELLVYDSTASSFSQLVPAKLSATSSLGAKLAPGKCSGSSLTYVPPSPQTPNEHPRLFLFGGSGVGGNGLHIFDLASKTWVEPTYETDLRPPALESHSAVYFTGEAGTGAGRRLVIFGGAVNGASVHRSNNVYFLLIKDNGKVEWKIVDQRGSWPVGRSSHSAVIWGDKMVVFGGLADMPARLPKDIDREQLKRLGLDNHFASNSCRSMNDLWVFDIISELWDTRAGTVGSPRPFPRCGHTAAMFLNQMYLFNGQGGESKEDGSASTMEDVVSDVWYVDLGPPPPPGELIIDSVTRARIKVSWVDPFRYQRNRNIRIYARQKKTSAAWKLVFDDLRQPTSTAEIRRMGLEPNAPTLQPGTEYELRLVAVNEFGETESRDLSYFVSGNQGWVPGKDLQVFLEQSKIVVAKTSSQVLRAARPLLFDVTRDYDGDLQIFFDMNPEGKMEDCFNDGNFIEFRIDCRAAVGMEEEEVVALHDPATRTISKVVVNGQLRTVENPPKTEIRQRFEAGQPIDTFRSFYNGSDPNSEGSWFNVWKGGSDENFVKIPYETLYKSKEVLSAYKDVVRKFRETQAKLGYTDIVQVDGLDAKGFPTSTWPVVDIAIWYTLRVYAVTDVGNGYAAEYDLGETSHKAVYCGRTAKKPSAPLAPNPSFTDVISAMIPEYAMSPAKFLGIQNDISLGPIISSPSHRDVPNVANDPSVFTNLDATVEEDVMESEEVEIDGGFAPAPLSELPPIEQTQNPPEVPSTSQSSAPTQIPQTSYPAQASHLAQPEMHHALHTLVQAFDVTIAAQEIEKAKQQEDVRRSEDYSGLRQLGVAAAVTEKYRSASRSPSLARRKLSEKTQEPNSRLSARFDSSVIPNATSPRITTDANLLNTSHRSVASASFENVDLRLEPILDEDLECAFAQDPPRSGSILHADGHPLRADMGMLPLPSPQQLDFQALLDAAQAPQTNVSTHPSLHPALPPVEEAVSVEAPVRDLEAFEIEDAEEEAPGTDAHTLESTQSNIPEQEDMQDMPSSGKRKAKSDGEGLDTPVVGETPAKKRRGRPPKASKGATPTAATPITPRRRGRKPKASSLEPAVEQSQLSSPLKAAAATPVKRPRGRPKASVVAEAVGDGEEAANFDVHPDVATAAGAETDGRDHRSQTPASVQFSHERMDDEIEHLTRSDKKRKRSIEFSDDDEDEDYVPETDSDDEEVDELDDDDDDGDGFATRRRRSSTAARVKPLDGRRRGQVGRPPAEGPKRKRGRPPANSTPSTSQKTRRNSRAVQSEPEDEDEDEAAESPLPMPAEPLAMDGWEVGDESAIWYCKMKFGDRIEVFSPEHKGWYCARIVYYCRFKNLPDQTFILIHYDGYRKNYDMYWDIREPRNFRTIRQYQGLELPKGALKEKWDASQNSSYGLKHFSAEIRNEIGAGRVIELEEAPKTILDSIEKRKQELDELE
ncbi:hypothetical protein HDU97_009530 [Phlyctochytrium planicorne]|nr:hypothetical protein HDU97_009530 [Phlyctochytrium planicorne]